jgi:DNA-binding GntR family transcriptional regulator
VVVGSDVDDLDPIVPDDREHQNCTIGRREHGGILEAIDREHGGILEAIEKRDEAQSVERMERHLQEACRDVAKFLDEADGRRLGI